MSPALLLALAAALGIALGILHVPLSKHAHAAMDDTLAVIAGAMLVVGTVLITAAAAGFILLACGMI